MTLLTKGLEGTNFWNKKTHYRSKHTVQSIVGIKENTKDANRRTSRHNSGCGEGSCNCDGGCNGECAQ